MMNKKKIMHVAQSAGGVYRYLESFLMYSNKEKYDISIWKVLRRKKRVI